MLINNIHSCSGSSSNSSNKIIEEGNARMPMKLVFVRAMSSPVKGVRRVLQ